MELFKMGFSIRWRPMFKEIRFKKYLILKIYILSSVLYKDKEWIKILLIILYNLCRLEYILNTTRMAYSWDRWSEIFNCDKERYKILYAFILRLMFCCFIQIRVFFFFLYNFWNYSTSFCHEGLIRSGWDDRNKIRVIHAKTYSILLHTLYNIQVTPKCFGQHVSWNMLQ